MRNRFSPLSFASPIILLAFMIVGTNVAAQFPSPLLFAKGTKATALLTGDFNNDGKLDIASLASLSSNPRAMILLGNGSSGFKAPTFTSITSVTSPNALFSGDFNNDGKLDLVVGGHDAVTGNPTFSVFLGKGDGTFQSPITTQGAVNILGNFNRDGNLDIVTATGDILLGKGDGTFSAPKSISQPLPNCAVAGDVNNDGKLDIAGQTAVLLGNGDGTFQAPLTIPDQNQFCGTVLADINHDGALDMLQVQAGNLRGSGGIIVFLGNGDGTFQKGAKIPFNRAPTSLAVADFNGDGNLDVAAFRGGPVGGSGPFTDITVLIGDGKGGFQLGNRYVGGTASKLGSNLVAGDFNGDHKVDLAIPNLGAVGVLLGNGDGTFQSGISITGPATLSISSFTLRTADFNGDGKSDILLNGFLLLSLGNGKFGPPLVLPNGCSDSIFNPSTVVADFNKDGKLDLASTYGTSATTRSGVTVCLGNGDGTFQSAVVYDSGTTHGVVRVGDFNKDGNLDIAVADIGGVSILLGNGDGTFQSAIPTAVGSSPVFTVGDFNHDGKLDLVAIVGSNVSVLLGKGDGTFQSPVSSPNVAAVQIAAADLNKDTHFDVVTANGSSNNLSVLLGNGNGTFQAATLYPVRANPTAVVIHDFNGDGNLDIAVPDDNKSSSLVSLLLGKGDGTFQKQKTFQVIPFPINVASADFNGNGGQDLAVLCSGGGSLTILLNNGAP